LAEFVVGKHPCGTHQAQTDLKIGVNPSDRRVASRIEEQRTVEATLEAEAQRLVHDATLQALFEQWVRDGVSRKDGNAEIRRSFGKDVLPELGIKPIRAITEHDLRGLLRTMVARGVNRVAVTLSRDIRQMFAWAEKRQPWRRLLQDGNPADLIEIEKIVSPEYGAVQNAESVQTLFEVYRKALDCFGVDTAVFTSYLRDDATRSSYRSLPACYPVWASEYARHGWCEDDPGLRHAAHDTGPIR